VQGILQCVCIQICWWKRKETVTYFMGLCDLGLDPHSECSVLSPWLGLCTYFSAHDWSFHFCTAKHKTFGKWRTVGTHHMPTLNCRSPLQTGVFIINLWLGVVEYAPSQIWIQDFQGSAEAWKGYHRSFVGALETSQPDTDFKEHVLWGGDTDFSWKLNCEGHGRKWT
jgi:hypothetical protein